MVTTRARTLAGLVVAAATGWLAARILGEYPFTGVLPIVGGFFLGVVVVAVAASVAGGELPVWAVVAAAVVAVWAEWQAAWIDSGGDGFLADGGLGPLPGEAYVAIAAAGLGALARLVPVPGRRPREGAPPASADPEPPESQAD